MNKFSKISQLPLTFLKQSTSENNTEKQWEVEIFTGKKREKHQPIQKINTILIVSSLDHSSDL